MIKEEKVCSVCKVLKPKEEFNIDFKANKLSSKCKKCKIQYKGDKERFIRDNRVFCIIDMKAKDAPTYPQFKFNETERKCKVCEETKPLDQFEKVYNGENKFKHTCKKCVSSRKNELRRGGKADVWKEGKISTQAITEIKCLFRRQHPNIDYSFITVDWYQKLLEEQGNCCAICKRDLSYFNKRLAVDHCHTTGKVRGLLCHNCNTAIGNLKDDVNVLKSAIEYIENPPHYKFEE